MNKQKKTVPKFISLVEADIRNAVIFLKACKGAQQAKKPRPEGSRDHGAFKQVKESQWCQRLGSKGETHGGLKDVSTARAGRTLELC